MAEAETIARPAVVTWPKAGETTGPVWINCPNCGSDTAKNTVLLASVRPVDSPELNLRLLKCDDCTAFFYENPRVPDYRIEGMQTPGGTTLHLQQGAGLRHLCKPVFRILKPAGSFYLDVGCGIGFGLDFAQTAQGWAGEGIDPGPYGRLGCTALGLNIAPRILAPEEPAMQGRFDVVMSAETIEHVPSPSAFLNTLAAVLKPDGVLALTTPDAGAIGTKLAPVQLAGLLSPAQHVVLQSRASLETLLKKAGFSHIRIEHDGYSLLAYASRAPLTLDDDETRFSVCFQNYLEGRAANAGLPRDLALGFAGRAVLEAANAGDFAAVARLRPVMDRLCAQYFDFDLQNIESLPPKIQTLSLQDMAGLVPLNLAGILYGYAISGLAEGKPRAELVEYFNAAAMLASALQQAAGALGLSDGLSEDLAWVGAAEALLCQAEAAGPEFISKVAALPAAPGPGGKQRRQDFIDRIFAALVNAGDIAAAAELRTRQAVGEDGAILLFAHAVVDLNAAGDAASAREKFAKAAALAGHNSGLRANALQGEAEAASRCGLAAQSSQV